jgi:hypothetical protein
MVDLDRDQVTQLLKLFGDSPAEISVEYHEDGPDGPGVYAWFTECPEDGKQLLSKDTSVRRDTIAASPELLAAAKMAIDFIEHPGKYPDCQPVYGLLRGAVFKATKRASE